MSDINRVDGLGGVSRFAYLRVGLVDANVLRRWQAHGTELGNIYGGGDLGDYLIRFAATLDPNGGDAVHWPSYSTDAPKVLVLSDNVPKLSIILDTYRAEGMAYITNLSLADPM